MYKRALVLGRFQPFHNGHLEVIRRALEISESVIIAVGSINLADKDNPIGYKDRVAILRKMIGKEGISDKVREIVGVRDFPDDDEWAGEVVRMAGMFDVVVGNNDWTNRVMKSAGYEVVETGMFNREELEGAKIRALFREGDAKWESRVPDYLVADIRRLLGGNE